MSWWNLPGSESEWTGDTPADLAAMALAPLAEVTPKPTADQLLDAIELVLRADLADRGLEWRARPRQRSTAREELVTLFGDAATKIGEAYLDEFKREPTSNELLYTLGFELRGDPTVYTSDAEKLTAILMTAR